MLDGSERISAILQTFPEAFKAQFGRNPTKDEIIRHLETLFNEKVKTQLNSTFNGLNGNQLQMCIETIKTGSFEHIDSNEPKPVESSYKAYKQFKDSKSLLENVTMSDTIKKKAKK